jgi:hypothetical protein
MPTVSNTGSPPEEADSPFFPRVSGICRPLGLLRPSRFFHEDGPLFGDDPVKSNTKLAKAASSDSFLRPALP